MGNHGKDVLIFIRGMQFHIRVSYSAPLEPVLQTLCPLSCPPSPFPAVFDECLASSLRTPLLASFSAHSFSELLSDNAS